MKDKKEILVEDDPTSSAAQVSTAVKSMPKSKILESKPQSMIKMRATNLFDLDTN